MFRSEDNCPPRPGAAAPAEVGGGRQGLSLYRVFDVGLSLLALLFLAPIFLVIGVVVRL